MSKSTVNPIATNFHAQWKDMIQWASGYIDKLSDEELSNPVAPGRNHGVWILGHLIESEDELSMYLGKGEMLFPEYIPLLGMKSKILPVESYKPALVLREQWKQVIAKNEQVFSSLTDAEWNVPPAKVEGDENNDLYRTKGRCVYLWNLHQMYHVGQLALLLARFGKTTY